MEKNEIEKVSGLIRMLMDSNNPEKLAEAERQLESLLQGADGTIATPFTNSSAPQAAPAFTASPSFASSADPFGPPAPSFGGLSPFEAQQPVSGFPPPSPPAFGNDPFSGPFQTGPAAQATWQQNGRLAELETELALLKQELKQQKNAVEELTIERDATKEQAEALQGMTEMAVAFMADEQRALQAQLARKEESGALARHFLHHVLDAEGALKKVFPESFCFKHTPEDASGVAFYCLAERYQTYYLTLTGLKFTDLPEGMRTAGAAPLLQAFSQMWLSVLASSGRAMTAQKLALEYEAFIRHTLEGFLPEGQSFQMVHAACLIDRQREEASFASREAPAFSSFQMQMEEYVPNGSSSGRPSLGLLFGNADYASAHEQSAEQVRQFRVPLPKEFTLYLTASTDLPPHLNDLVAGAATGPFSGQPERLAELLRQSSNRAPSELLIIGIRF